MSSQDNSIRKKLQQLNDMPEGISFHAAETWNRIEDKLQTRRTGNKAWLRYAAVFLLVISGTIIYLRSGDRTKQIEAAGTDLQANPVFSPGVTKNDHNSTVEITTTTKKTTPAGYKKVIKRSDPIIDENDYVMGEFPLAPSTPISEVTVSITNPVIETPVPIVVAPKTTAKKPKLRIVHLNDIYKPDITEIAKAETKKQEAKEEIQETEPLIVNPPKPFWKSKASQRIAISLTDNP